VEDAAVDAAVDVVPVEDVLGRGAGLFWPSEGESELVLPFPGDGEEPAGDESTDVLPAEAVVAPAAPA